LSTFDIWDILGCRFMILRRFEQIRKVRPLDLKVASDFKARFF
jgi:hypothetical protein